MLFNQNIPPDSMSGSFGPPNFVEVSEEQEIQIFAKQMLLHRMFIGHYQERRYVETLKSYRDVVVVHETEDKLERDLETVRKRIQSFYGKGNLWIGITGPNMIGAPAASCVWVKLQNMAFGYYWFQVRQVKFCDNQEVCLRLKCIRGVNPEVIGLGPNVKQDAHPSFESVPSSKGAENTPPCSVPSAPEKEEDETNPEPADLGSTFSRWQTSLRLDQALGNVLTGFCSLMTIRNAKEATTFLTLLLVAIVTAAVNLLGYVGDFTIKFMRELSVLIQACTPFFLAIIDFLSKCVGGFYLLILSLWRGSPAKFPPRPYPEQSTPMLTYRSGPPPYGRYRSDPRKWH